MHYLFSGKRSLAYRLTYQTADGSSLREADVEHSHALVCHRLTELLPATVRNRVASQA